MERILLLLAYGKDNVDKATIGLSLAKAALDQGEQVDIVLMSEGVRLGVRGYADDMDNGEPFKPIRELMDAAVEKGAQLYICMPCVKNRKIEEDQLLEGINQITGPDVITLTRDSTRQIQL